MGAVVLHGSVIKSMSCCGVHCLKSIWPCGGLSWSQTIFALIYYSCIYKHDMLHEIELWWEASALTKTKRMLWKSPIKGNNWTEVCYMLLEVKTGRFYTLLCNVFKVPPYWGRHICKGWCTHVASRLTSEAELK